MIEGFLTYLRSEKRYSELTVRAYGVTAPPTPEEEADILRSFDLTLSEGNDLRGWIMHLTGTKNLSARSVNRKISSVKSLYRYLRKKGIVAGDPFVRISALKTPQRLPSFVEDG